MSPAPQPPVNPPCPTGKPSSFTQTWLWGRCGPTWGKDLRTFSILFGLPALLIWFFGLDTPIARALHHTDISHAGHILATALRRYGTLPGALLAVAGLIALIWPNLWRHRPTLYRVALVTTLTAVIGVGLVNQIVVKKLADRPRPQESVLIDTPTTTDAFRGNSMPSGHAAMGFLLAAPFFPLRRSKPKLAATFLATGLITGGIVGLSRMALGAHFATDVLIAGLITLSAAAIFTHFAQRITRIRPHIIAIAVFVFAHAVILGNRFTNLTLTLDLPADTYTSFLPCGIRKVTSPAVTTPTLAVQLSGYGAPLSTLQLYREGTDVRLQRHFGFYHHLTCTAVLVMPAK